MSHHGQTRIFAELDDEARMVGLKVGRSGDNRTDIAVLQASEDLPQLGLASYISLDQL
jgi:hypothetical protein